MNLGGDNSSNSSEELCHSTLNSNSTFIRNVDFWGDGVFTFVCGLIGVIGNFMTIIIFRYFENLQLGPFEFLEATVQLNHNKPFFQFLPVCLFLVAAKRFKKL